ncbi:hypothetical protein KGA66_00505 [Actinocrinis puniceicyclus]|uniref:Lipopolysaccharide assembly protein A domain-containing protein n=1 Tax=Actinocrinis puniceicyclus TaxID=977794 RepID=A0A8J7WIF0_9ACTN|nr:hypothetical protein [Actinocrinis puniceicyclus]MBS2961505.1 hypothetical protein [Actinocrinis puniceicyclus]
MLLLGLLLAGAAGAFTGLLIAYNASGGPEYTVTMFGNTLGTLNTLEIFISGIVLALIFCLGLLMMRGGAAMARRRRVSRREQRRQTAAALAERDAMANRLRDTGSYEGDPAVTATQTDVAATTPRRRHRPHVFGH